MWIICVISVLSHQLIAGLWSPAGKGLTSWLSFVMLNCEIVTVPFCILCQVWYLIVSIHDQPQFLVSYCTHSTTYIGCSSPVTAYKLIIFRPSTTRTMPFTTQILRTATKWFATSQTKKQNLCKTFYSYTYSSLCDVIKS